MDKAHLREILERRVRDGVVLRLIGKWLNAGVLEGKAITYSDTGTPQGGVISPILANIYLHDALDLWFKSDVKPHMKGPAFLIRYADDAILGFAREDDARRVMEVLPKRFAKYGLTLHPEKTRLVDFRKPNGPPAPLGGAAGAKPGTFNLLGFTHYWGKSRSGTWVVKRKTAKDRLARAIRRVADWCRDNRHLPIGEQQQTLERKLRGHYGYYGIIGNFQSLSRFAHAVANLWLKWLGQRSRKAHRDWAWFNRLLERYPLPPPRIARSTSRSAANPG
ncbi:MAG: RNA-directed DNA polymerase [Chloroflexi bacterium]|nr:RNA-directed DNA polymerase [Chloroflexota bacterium]